LYVREVLMGLPASEDQDFVPNVYVFVIKVEIVHRAHGEAPFFVELASFDNLPLSCRICEV
jgi:hypothetical protein